MEHDNCPCCHHQDQKIRKLEDALKSIRENLQNPGTSTSLLLNIIDSVNVNNDHQFDFSQVENEREKDDKFSQSQSQSQNQSQSEDVKPAKISKLSESTSSQDFSQSQSQDSQATFSPLTPQAKALSNSLVVRKIVGFLNPHDLLWCRLVNRCFWEEATHTLLLPNFRRAFSIHFIWSENNQQFFHSHPCGTIRDFHSIYSKSFLTAHNQSHNPNHNINMNNGSGFGFPCRFLSFWGGNVNAFDCGAFFHEHGRTIKSLKIFMNQEAEPKTSSSTLRRLFFEWLPNLEYLGLGCPHGTPDRQLPSFLIRHQNQEAPAPAPAPVLPNLRILDVSDLERDGHQIVGDILSLASNLEETIDPPLNFLDKILTAQKQGTVKILDLRIGPFSDLEPFLEFSETNPTLKELRIHFIETFGYREPNPTTKKILENLLESSKLTLERISPLNPLASFESLRIPVMEKVKFLVVETKRAILPIIFREGRGRGQGQGQGQGQGRDRAQGMAMIENLAQGGFEVRDLLPQNIHMVEVFPRLEELHFRSYRQPPNFLQGFRLDTARPHFNITAVTVQIHNVQLNWLRDLSVFCPQAKRLNIEKVKMEDLPEILKFVWRDFQGLQEFFVSTNFWQNPFSSPVLNQVDSAFTGYSLERVEHLRTLDFDDFYLSQQGIEFPSILDMKELKHFKLHVALPTFSYKPVISKVSAFYAFNPMVKRQGLKVDIKSPFPVPELISV